MPVTADGRGSSASATGSDFLGGFGVQSPRSNPETVGENGDLVRTRMVARVG
jgi:hypothetical protein